MAWADRQSPLGHITKPHLRSNILCVESAGESDSQTQYKLGVALGGGSARGYAHLGALASLERHGLAPDLIVGTSFGAVMGALYASGRPLASIIAQAGAVRRRDVFPYIADFGLHRAALFSGKKLEEYFSRLTEGREFSDLERKLVVVTTDIDSGELVLVDEGSLATALRASASIPGIFAPTKIGGRRLVDGGIGAPVPLATLEAMNVRVAIGIGAGMEAKDSSAIRFTRRLLTTRGGKKLHQKAVASRPRGALGRLGKGLAYAADGWLKVGDAASAVSPAVSGCKRLEVHTRPPIHWLNFHRALDAIRAGEAALSQLMPTVMLAVSAP